VQGKPATSLTTVFRVNQPLAAGTQASVQTSGGPVLDTATPKAFGTSGLCYSVSFTTATPIASGGIVQFVLGGLAPDAELVRLYAAKKVRVPANLLGGNC
jgi:hypothetical protein